MRSILFAALAVQLVACGDQPFKPPQANEPEGEEEKVPPAILGLVEVTISGLGSPEPSASASPIDVDEIQITGPNGALVPVGTGGVQLEPIQTGSFTEGTRSMDGQRYMWATFRVRNATAAGAAYGTARNNLTFMAVGTNGTIAGTPVAVLNRFDGSPASTSIASSVVPTGAIVLDEEYQPKSQFPDVLQVFSEAEVDALAAPAAVTNKFPYGFVTRNPSTPNSRTLPANPDAGQFDGLVTFAYRVPLQPSDAGTTNGASKDPFSISIVFLAVDDSETQLTESIEEQTAESRAAIQARATALGATRVTVLNGSASTGYTGQRQICSVRTAGTAAAAVTYITSPGAFSRVVILRPGESIDACSANFRTGSPGRPATNVPFDVMAYAMDRYGNVKTTSVDSVTISSALPSTTVPSASPLVAGSREFTVTFTQYGVDTLKAASKHVRGWQDISISGVTRNWLGDTSSDWSTGENWEDGAAPMNQDSVNIPASRPNYPTLSQNVAVRSVTVASGASINLSSFDLTATGSVAATGPITSTTGRLFLSGASETVSGTLPRLRVNGTYSLTGNVTAVAPLQVDAGRITDGAFRLQISN